MATIKLDIQPINNALDRFCEAVARTQAEKRIDLPASKLESKLRILFKRQGSDVLKRLDRIRVYFTESALGDEFNDIFDRASLSTSSDMADYIDEAVKAMFLNGANDVMDSFGLKISFSLDNPRAVAYTEQYGAASITGIDDTTREALKKILTAGVENGDSYNKVAKAIRDKYNSYANTRAKLIAVTELGNAYQAGNVAMLHTMQDTGLVMEKHWLTSGDGKVSAGCKENQAAGWILLDETFPSGDDRPLRFPGCRCVLQARRRKEATKPVTAPKAKPAKTTTKASAAKFDIDKQESYNNLSKTLDTLFKDTKSNWSGKVIPEEIESGALANYTWSSGDIRINPIYYKDKRYADQGFAGLVHEMIHARSKGKDYNVEGIGWEEAVIERSTQLHVKAIAKEVGYTFNDYDKYTKQLGKHPYNRWIAPLEEARIELGFTDENSFYQTMLGKSCEDRRSYIKDAYFKKYGKNEGRTKFIALATKLQ